MRGHQPLKAMRMRGRCPEAVWICVGEDHSGSWQDWFASPTGGRWGDLSAAVDILPHERLSGLHADFRTFVGMGAFVQGSDEARTIAVAEMCLEAGCKRCFVTVHDPLTHKAISGFFYTEEVPPWQEF